VQEVEKTQLKSQIQCQTASYEDELSVAKREQEKLGNEYQTKLTMKLEKEKELNDGHIVLEEKIQKLDLETEKQLKENKEDESNLQLLVQECMVIRMKLDKNKETYAHLAEESAQLKLKNESLDARIKLLHGQLQKVKDEKYAI
jgi:hypothetical protein